MKSLLSLNEVKELIQKGENLLLAGSEDVLSQLPQGTWIGGTIPYFMSPLGGSISNEKIQVTLLPDYVQEVKIKEYQASELDQMPANYLANGFSMAIIPAFSEAHRTFAKDCSTWNGIFNQPLVGWISGTDLKQPHLTPKVFNGLTGTAFNDRAVVLHAKLKAGKIATANIINIFEQDDSDVLMFSKSGFESRTALINGREVILADYLKEKKVDLTIPLVADYLGAMINVSFRDIDPNGNVRFFAPVFPQIKYRFAKRIANYETAFEAALKQHDIGKPLFACNCVLNFLYAHLEGKTVGDFSSPMTFGEIAYMLLNQTFVYVVVQDRPEER